MRRCALLMVVALAAALALAACTPSDAQIVRAAFDDVADLTVRGGVKIADVTVGTVTGISLTEDNRALVEMAVRPDVRLPSRLRAELRKTSVLGERYINLIPDVEAGGTWESGGTVAETRRVPELEELVRSGSELLSSVAVDRIAGAIEAGAEGLGGRGPVFRQLLDDLGLVVATYNANSDDLVRLIDGFEAFLAETGPRADLHGRALTEFARFTTVLREEDERLLDALSATRGLAQSGLEIMQVHRARLDRSFRVLNAITAELVERGSDLDRLFFEVSKHNHNTIRGVNAEHAQVLLDFIACGENDTPGDPVRACQDPPQGRPRPEPPPRAGGGS